MDDILKRIIEIEDKAHNIVEDVKKESAGFDEEIERSINDLRKEIDEKTDTRIRQMAETESEYMRDEIDKIKKINKANLNKINKMYEENKERWIIDAFKMIIEEGS